MIDHSPQWLKNGYVVVIQWLKQGLKKFGILQRLDQKQNIHKIIITYVHYLQSIN